MGSIDGYVFTTDIDKYFIQNVYLQYFNIIEHIKNNTCLYIHICTHICREKENKKNT